MDLISKLADDLIALINASPRSPRKDQIEDVLRKGIAHSCATDLAAWPDRTIAWSTLFRVPDTPLGQERVTFAGTEDIPVIKWSGPSDPTSWTFTHENLVKVATECAHNWCSPGSANSSRIKAWCSFCGATKP